MLKSSKEPSMKFSNGTKASFGCPDKLPIMLFWPRTQTLETWMEYSVVWFSQEITRKLGMEKFKEYTKKLNYGKADVFGNPGKNDGVFRAWLGSSLLISPLEQVEFIEKLSKGELPISKEAQEKTINLISLEDMWDDWKLYEKIGGSGSDISWFVGWIEKGNRRIEFAMFIGKNESSITSGRIAKELTKDKFAGLIVAPQ